MAIPRVKVVNPNESIVETAITAQRMAKIWSA